jgi:hypothetical protein
MSGNKYVSSQIPFIKGDDEWNDLQCSICFKEWDENNIIPRMLPLCGHTFCTECLNRLYFTNIKNCPDCRKEIIDFGNL